jgi:hypothetical protein
MNPANDELRPMQAAACGRGVSQKVAFHPQSFSRGAQPETEGENENQSQ